MVAAARDCSTLVLRSLDRCPASLLPSLSSPASAAAAADLTCLLGRRRRRRPLSPRTRTVVSGGAHEEKSGRGQVCLTVRHLEAELQTFVSALARGIRPSVRPTIHPTVPPNHLVFLRTGSIRLSLSPARSPIWDRRSAEKDAATHAAQTSETDRERRRPSFFRPSRCPASITHRSHYISRVSPL